MYYILRTYVNDALVSTNFEISAVHARKSEGKKSRNFKIRER